MGKRSIIWRNKLENYVSDLFENQRKPFAEIAEIIQKEKQISISREAAKVFFNKKSLQDNTQKNTVKQVYAIAHVKSNHKKIFEKQLKTPYGRVLEHPGVSDENKKRAMRIKAALDTAALHEKLEKACEELFCIAAKKAGSPVRKNSPMVRI